MLLNILQYIGQYPTTNHQTRNVNRAKGEKHPGLDSMPGSLNCDLRTSRVNITSELVRDLGPNPEALNEILWFNNIPR